MNESGLYTLAIDRPIIEESGDYYTLVRLVVVDKYGELQYDYLFNDMGVVSEGHDFTVTREDERFRIELMEPREGDILVTLRDAENGNKAVFQNVRFRIMFDKMPAED